MVEIRTDLQCIANLNTIFIILDQSNKNIMVQQVYF